MLLAAIFNCATLSTLSYGEEYKKGQEVVALRNAELKVEAKTVGTVRKGEKVTVEAVQDEWLWVRCAETRGWIERGIVMDAALMAWYERQPDMATIADSLTGSPQRVDKSGRGRAKILGVTFEVLSLHPGDKPSVQSSRSGGGIVQMGTNNSILSNNRALIQTNVGNNLGGDGAVVGVRVAYDGVEIAVRTATDRRRELSVNGTRYGTVEKGDHVSVSESRQVFVNGTLRTPTE